MATPDGETTSNGAADESPSLPLRCVPIVRETYSLDEHETARQLDQFDRHMNNELHRRQRDYQYALQRMRSGFLRLLPADVSDDSTARKTSSPSSTADIVPIHKVRRLYFEYPDSSDDFTEDDDVTLDDTPTTSSANDNEQLSNKVVTKSRGRYQLRFDVNDLEPSTVAVEVQRGVIVVRGMKATRASVTDEDDMLVAKSVPFVRRIAKPSPVDPARLRSFLSADGILTIEAPLFTNTSATTQQALDRQMKQLSTDEHVSPTGNERVDSEMNGKNVDEKPTASADDDTKPIDATLKSPRGSLPDVPGGKKPGAGTDSPGGGSGSGGGGTGEAGATTKEKIGVPIFRDESGTRRMHLAVDLGSMYRPRDVIVQVIKENRIQIRAKHLEKKGERQSKNKFVKDYELGEKIEAFSLQGGLTPSGKLIICAYAKGHGPFVAE